MELQKFVKAWGGTRINSGKLGVQPHEIVPGEIALKVTDLALILEHTVYTTHSYQHSHLLALLRNAVGDVEMNFETTKKGRIVHIIEKVPWLGKPLLEETAREALEHSNNKNSKAYARAIKKLKDCLI